MRRCRWGRSQEIEDIVARWLRIVRPLLRSGRESVIHRVLARLRNFAAKVFLDRIIGSHRIRDSWSHEFLLLAIIPVGIRWQMVEFASLLFAIRIISWDSAAVLVEAWRRGLIRCKTLAINLRLSSLATDIRVHWIHISRWAMVRRILALIASNITISFILVLRLLD